MWMAIPLCVAAPAATEEQPNRYRLSVDGRHHKMGVVHKTALLVDGHSLSWAKKPYVLLSKK